MATTDTKPQKEQGIGLGLLKGLAVTLRTMPSARSPSSTRT